MQESKNKGIKSQDNSTNGYQGVFGEIVDTIGEDTAEKLSENFGGEHVYIPKASEHQRLKRNMLIKREFDGCNYRELGRKYSLSTRQIHNIVNNRD
ncbi:MAG: hypothetical protein JJT76_17540 [Clostridiaceae bacterium]|nr:hypothetical protein [Clostridiaceae bacterium]